MFGIAWALLLSLLVQCNGKIPPKEKYHSNKNELKYAECTVCQQAMKVLSRNVTSLRRKTKKEWETSEALFSELMENMCDPDSKQGEWIRKLDLVPGKGRLVVEEKINYGNCRTECRTISKICSKLMKKHGITISELLWKKTKRNVLSPKVCRKLSTSCNKKTLKKLKESKITLGEEKFDPMSDAEWEKHKLKGTNWLTKPVQMVEQFWTEAWTGVAKLYKDKFPAVSRPCRRRWKLLMKYVNSLIKSDKKERGVIYWSATSAKTVLTVCQDTWDGLADLYKDTPSEVYKFYRKTWKRCVKYVKSIDNDTPSKLVKFGQDTWKSLVKHYRNFAKNVLLQSPKKEL